MSRKTAIYPRHITPSLLAALADTPVVVLHGPRQAGKSTLARGLADMGHAAAYVTLDDPATLAAARSDPVGFLAGNPGPLIIDEIQRAPELVLPIKADVDRNRRPGRFLLTGSAHVLNVPKLADALVGRMQVLTLRPLSQSEIERRTNDFIDLLFAAQPPNTPRPPTNATSARAAKHPRSALAAPLGKSDLARRILCGGFPEALTRHDARRRHAWFTAYLSGVLLRDVRELANIEGLTDLPRLVTAAAGRAGGLLNYADIARDVGLNAMTARRYWALLVATFLVHTVQPWFTNRVKRIVKSEKLYFGDTGMLGHVLEATPERLAADPRLGGLLLENFVAAELLKQLEWSQTRASLWHFRDHDSHEVDFVLEEPGGQSIVGIEVKNRATLDADDVRGLRVLAQAAGERFHRGVVLYTGGQVVPFAKNLHAIPVSVLW